MERATIGIFGGSGLYKLLDNVETVKIETPYGAPSDSISIGTFQGKKVAFIPRHGASHTLPPHMINYRANLHAFKSIGVKFVIGPCAAGSLQSHIKPGDFVICDQFVDRTSGRKDTFYDGPITTHVLGEEPYEPYLRTLALNAAKACNVTVHESGTVVVIQGPRFSTKAESKWFSQSGFDVINMTQYPEAILARELEMAYVNISLITDYDSGVEGVTASSVQDMIKVFGQNIENVKKVLEHMIAAIDLDKDCMSHHALAPARFL